MYCYCLGDNCNTGCLNLTSYITRTLLKCLSIFWFIHTLDIWEKYQEFQKWAIPSRFLWTVETQWSMYYSWFWLVLQEIFLIPNATLPMSWIPVEERMETWPAFLAPSKSFQLFGVEKVLQFALQLQVLWNPTIALWT